jgi:hypothetical protein
MPLTTEDSPHSHATPGGSPRPRPEGCPTKLAGRRPATLAYGHPAKNAFRKSKKSCELTAPSWLKSAAGFAPKKSFR